MDLEGNGNLDRQNFVYGINSSIKKISTIGPSRKLESVLKEPEANGTPGNTGMGSSAQANNDRMQFSKYVDSMVYDRMQSGKKNINAESRVSINEESKLPQESAINVKIPLESLSPEEVLGRLKQESGISLPQFYE